MAVMGFQFRVTSISQSLVHLFMVIVAAFYFILGKFRISVRVLILILVMILTILLNIYGSQSPIPQVIFILSIIKGVLVGLFFIYPSRSGTPPENGGQTLLKAFC